MTFLQRHNQQIVKTGARICAHVDDVWIDDLDQRTNHFTGRDTKKLVFLRRFAHDCSDIDRVSTPRHFSNMENRKLSRLRVVPKMVAERPLHLSFTRLNDALQDELCSRRNHNVDALRSNHWNALPPKEPRKSDFIHVLRQRQYRSHHEDGVGADDDSYLQVLPLLLRFPIM